MVFNGVKNYYEILEISAEADLTEIKSAYRKLARKYHPDINKEDKAIEIFKKITLAYETLSNEEERKKYNILNGIFVKSATQESTQQKQQEEETKEKTSPPKTEFTQKKSEKQKIKEDINTKFKDKYENKKTLSFTKKIKYFFAKLKKNKRAKENLKPKKGEDLKAEVIITPETVMTGSKRVINIRTTKTCPKCNGHKFANGDKCPQCGGKGTITETKKITLTIPKGVKNGTKLRLKEEGATGKNGGPNGDVYVTIRIETKTQIQFDKLNIHYNIPITPFEAALGEEITIPAFDGTIKLKLPKNTCSGQKFRIAKQGLRRNGKIGDLIVTVSIEFSHNLSDDEIRLYEQLKNLSNDNLRKNLKYGS